MEIVEPTRPATSGRRSLPTTRCARTPTTAPDWTVTEDNNGLYATAGPAACRTRLIPGGVLTVWSAQPSTAFEEALTNMGFTQVRTIGMSVARGVPDVVHLAMNPHSPDGREPRTLQ
jgi:hypothetical protein